MSVVQYGRPDMLKLNPPEICPRRHPVPVMSPNHEAAAFLCCPATA